MLIDEPQAVAFSGCQPIKPVNTLVHSKPPLPCGDFMPKGESGKTYSTGG